MKVELTDEQAMMIRLALMEWQKSLALKVGGIMSGLDKAQQEMLILNKNKENAHAQATDSTPAAGDGSSIRG